MRDRVMSVAESGLSQLASDTWRLGLKKKSTQFKHTDIYFIEINFIWAISF